jgi:dTDP-glucose 4,6-dehydratase
MFLLDYQGMDELQADYGGAKCQKFNIVGAEELDNLELAQIIAEAQGKTLNYEMVDFHSQRPGHDLRYALDGFKMKSMGWTPQPVRERLSQVIDWSLENNRWLMS